MVDKQERLKEIKAEIEHRLSAIPKAHEILMESMKTYIDFHDIIDELTEEAKSLIKDRDCECCCPCKKKSDE